MTTRKNRPLTRRNFLKLGGLSVAAAGLSPLIQACGGAATTAAPAAATQAPAATEAMLSGETLKMWWWGEQEADRSGELAQRQHCQILKRRPAIPSSPPCRIPW